MSCLFEFTQNFMHLNHLQALKVVIFTFYESKLKKKYESPRASKDFNNSVSKIIMIKFLFTSFSTFPKAILNKSDIFESVVTWCNLRVDL